MKYFSKYFIAFFLSNELLLLYANAVASISKGREEFYKKCGFTARPNEKLGPGMIMYL